MKNQKPISTHSFPIKWNKKSSYWSWGISFVLAIVAVLVAFDLGKGAWAVVPWILLGVGITLHIGFALRKVHFEMQKDGLHMRGDMSTEFIATKDMDVTGARIIDLKAEAEFAPKWKLAGTSLPGYCSGWFKLRNGQKALAFLSDLENAVYIPTRKGYVILLSAENNSALLQAVQQTAHNV